MRITEIEGDLFDAPDGAVLIHACNCQGSWGGGIAEAFRKKYPAAYKVYNAHCKSLLKDKIPHAILDTTTEKARTIQLPLATALIIPPQVEDYSPAPTKSARGRNAHQVAVEEQIEKKKHWIVCLFTSRNYGRWVSRPDIILESSVHAIRDMRRQLEKLYTEEQGDDWHGKVYSCQFNSGLFNVPWEESRMVLERELAGMKAINEVIVVSPKKRHHGHDGHDDKKRKYEEL